MPLSDARQPPRFVPTLTDVVTEQTAQTLQNPKVEAIQALEASEAGEAVQLAAEVLLDAPVWTDSLEQEGVSAQSIQARVMARLDATLEARLRCALADVVQMHTHSLYETLREDVARLVNTAVHEAIAQELAQMRSAPAAQD